MLAVWNFHHLGSFRTRFWGHWIIPWWPWHPRQTSHRQIPQATCFQDVQRFVRGLGSSSTGSPPHRWPVKKPWNPRVNIQTAGDLWPATRGRLVWEGLLVYPHMDDMPKSHDYHDFFKVPLIPSDLKWIPSMATSQMRTETIIRVAVKKLRRL